VGRQASFCRPDPLPGEGPADTHPRSQEYPPGEGVTDLKKMPGGCMTRGDALEEAQGRADKEDGGVGGVEGRRVPGSGVRRLPEACGGKYPIPEIGHIILMIMLVIMVTKFDVIFFFAGKSKIWMLDALLN